MHGISCSAWHGAVVFESARSGIRPARSSPSPVVIYTRAVRSVISSDNHWPSLVSCCSRNCLEHFACLCPVITIYCNLSPAAEDILVPTVISGHHHLTLLCYRGLRNSYCGLVSDTANRSATSWQQTSRCSGIWETTRHNTYNGLLTAPTCYGLAAGKLV